MKNKKIIFITGVAGMLGSELIKKLLSPKNIIIGVDNFKLVKKKFIKNYLEAKNFHFFNIDLSKKIIHKLKFLKNIPFDFESMGTQKFKI